jgi:hypothetical protein
MKLWILLAILLSVSSYAEDPCNTSNVIGLFTGQKTTFYSRKQANDCLIRIKNNEISLDQIKIKAIDGKNNLFGFEYPSARGIDTRYLKQDGRDFFISKNILGNYVVKDKTIEGNKASAKLKFIPRECTEASKKICEEKNPSQNFNSDECRCEPKETLYCGNKKWTQQKRDDSKAKCEAKEESSWDEDDCSCSDIKYCGDKKWSKKKKEKEANHCIEKEGHEWDDTSCSCSEILYCREKKWSHSKYERESKKCTKDVTNIWDDKACECKVNPTTTLMCNGKVVEKSQIESETKACLDKNSGSDGTVIYEWDAEKCECNKEKVQHVCGGDEISEKKYLRKKNDCLENIAKDPLYSWNEEKCQCDKGEITKIVNLCGGKPMSEAKMNRKKNHCDKIKGKWDPTTCECEDPCYEAEERVETENIPCYEDDYKIGEVKVSDLNAKICEQAIPDVDKQKIKDQCQKEVDAFLNSSTDKQDLKTVHVKINYTSSEQVVCGEQTISANAHKEIDSPLPANVPTTDLSVFDGDCSDQSKGKYIKTSQADLRSYREKGKITCKEWENIQKANKEIKETSKQLVDDYFKNLNITGKISADEMTKLLSTAQINLEVLGTANRTRNGTPKSLDELANKRKVEAERVLKNEILSEIQQRVNGPNFQLPNQDKIFSTNSGLSLAIGPLNPTAPKYSMELVLKEKETPKELKSCLGDGKRTTKQMYDCSVDYFIDTECPRLKKELQDKFCQNDKEARRKELKSQTTDDFLEDFKMFRVGASLSSDSKKQITQQVGTIEVDCSTDITKGQIEKLEPKLTHILKVTKPGILRRWFKKDCIEERKKLNEEYGRKNVRKAANQRKNPNGIAIEE